MSTLITKKIQQAVEGSTTQELKIGGIETDGSDSKLRITSSGVVEVNTPSNSDDSDAIATTKFVTAKATALDNKIDSSASAFAYNKVKALVSKGGYTLNAILTNTDEVITWGTQTGGGASSFGRGWPTTDGTYLTSAPLQYPSGESGTLVDAKGWVHGGYLLFSTGNLYVSGYNSIGQLGFGDTTSRSVLKLVETNVVKVFSPIRVSYDHNNYRVFIIKTDGFLYGVGYNGQGALGIGSTTNANVYTKITTFEAFSIKDVWNFGGTYGSTVIQLNDNSLWACGYNGMGQLGIGNTTNQTSFINVTSNWGLTSTDVVSKVYCSAGFYNTAADGSSAIAILYGSENYAGKTLKISGDNGYASLGRGNTTDSSTPVVPINLEEGSVKNFWAHGGGPAAFYALKTDGSFYVWGYNGQGQLGIGSTANQTTPVNFVFQGETIREVFAESQGHTYSYFSTVYIQMESGKLYSAGENSNGQMGVGTSTDYTTSFTEMPYSYSKYGKIIDVSCNGYDAGGLYYTFLTETGDIFGLGYNGRYGLSIDGGNVNKSILTRIVY